jgi:cytochrome c peroxidase
MKYLLCFCFIICSATNLASELKYEPIKPIPSIIISEPGLVELGNRLFHEPRLSSDGTIACASCHVLANGGVDGAKLSTGVEGRMGTVNAPTVFNSSLNFRQFWDGRSLTLLEQINGPLNNPKEMASNWPHVLKVLESDKTYSEAFRQYFSDGLTINNIKLAIVKFEQSLLTPNSRFDQYLSGNDNALSPRELQGYSLFKNYGCISCHQGIGIGGNMFQKLGVMKDYFIDGEYSTADLGRFNITHDERDRHVFKVPSLRNVALTAPYLHNGKAATLDEAVKVMMTYQLGVDAPDEEVDLIVLFLETLTGEYQGDPL